MTLPYLKLPSRSYTTWKRKNANPFLSQAKKRRANARFFTARIRKRRFITVFCWWGGNFSQTSLQAGLTNFWLGCLTLTRMHAFTSKCHA